MTNLEATKILRNLNTTLAFKEPKIPMSELLTDKDKAMREKHGIEVQPDPAKDATAPSAHDMVLIDLSHTVETDTDADYEYGMLLEGFVSLCSKLDVDPFDTIMARKNFGLEKYGTILQHDNGRDHIKDAIDEMADALVYLKCAIDQEKSNV